MSWSLGRPFTKKDLGEPPPDSLRLVRLAWARLSVLALVSPAAYVSFNPSQSYKAFHVPRPMINLYKQFASSRTCIKTQLKLEPSLPVPGNVS